MIDTGRLIMTADYIYADSCSLMKFKRFEKFLRQYQDTLNKARKKVVIPKDVYMELQKLQDSSDPYKANMADCTLRMVNRNLDLLEIECQEATYDEIRRAFADTALLSRIALLVKKNSQLLITEDKKLTRDAIRFNSLECCKGKIITVCHVNQEGLLVQNEMSEAEEGSELLTTEIVNAEHETSEETVHKELEADIRLAEATENEEEQATVWYRIWNAGKRYAVPISFGVGAIAGIVFGLMTGKCLWDDQTVYAGETDREKTAR